MRMIKSNLLYRCSLFLAAAVGGAEAAAAAEGESHPVTAVLFPWFAEIIGVLTFFFLARYCHHLPFTAVMFLVGTLMGIAVTIKGYAANELATSIVQWTNIDGHVLLLVFLPGLLFKDAFEVNFHLFKKAFYQLLIMAFPMVLAGTVLVACIGYFVFPYSWSWALSMTFGSILAATDPVAVSVLLNEVGAPPRLKMHVSGESLLNDGSAVVFFTIFGSMFLYELGIAGLGQDVTVGEGFAIFFRMSIGGALIGIGFSLALLLILFLLNRQLNREENVVQVAAAVSIAYLSFYCAETLAHCSGVIAVVFCGIFTSAFGHSMVNDLHLMEGFVELLEWLLNTLLFALAGAVFGHVVANQESWRAVDWGYLILLWVLLNAVRFFLTFSAYPIISRIGLKSNLREATFLAFGGLRGAIGIALGLALEAETAGASVEHRRQVDALFGHVGGVAFLTLLINGTLAGPLLIKLRLADSTPMRKRIIEHFCKAAKEKVLGKFIFLLTDPRFKNTIDFSLIAHHVPILQDLTVEELEVAVEKNHANTVSDKYKEPNLSNVLPYLLQKQKSSVDLEGGSILLNSLKANAASVPGKSTSSTAGINFDELKALYAEDDKGPSMVNALISAAASGDLKTLQELLTLPSVDVNEGDYDKRTALHLAAGEGHVEIIKLLIKYNADVNVEDRFGNRPLDDAQRGKKSDAIELLRRHNALPGSNAQQSSDLIEAAAAGDIGEVEKILKSDAMTEYDINASDYDRRTCLHVAAAEGHADVVKLLCENGANVQAVDRWCNTPLDEARNGGHDDVVSVIERYAMRSRLQKSEPDRDLFGKGSRAIELRRIFLGALRQAYTEAIERGELDGRSVLGNVLLGSIEEAEVDASEGIALSDWKYTAPDGGITYIENGIREVYSLPFRKSFRFSSSLKTIKRHLDLRRTLAFIAAHTVAQQRFGLEFCSDDSDLSEFNAAKQLILRESMSEVETAEKNLRSHSKEDISCAASHLCCIILLNTYAKYMHYLSQAGLLLPKEANHFIEECDSEINAARACCLSDHPGKLTNEDKRQSICASFAGAGGDLLKEMLEDENGSGGDTGTSSTAQ